ncbi:hypothetical protein [Mycolicibacterium stellerae]|uniref:hypothetical protein n=1 Tax=Mycolicibacterium stellerae TaxID=2358193 RepID=UPI000F0B5FB2|nr:hypothetical protein [Mycolicibacterium stellerae]
MNTNKSKGFLRFAAATIAAAGILGGGALGFAAGANASTETPQQMKQEQSAEVRARQLGSETGQRAATPARPVAEPKRASIPDEHPEHERQARNG